MLVFMNWGLERKGVILTGSIQVCSLAATGTLRVWRQIHVPPRLPVSAGQA